MVPPTVAFSASSVRSVQDITFLATVELSLSDWHQARTLPSTGPFTSISCPNPRMSPLMCPLTLTLEEKTIRSPSTSPSMRTALARDDQVRFYLLAGRQRVARVAVMYFSGYR